MSEHHEHYYFAQVAAKRFYWRESAVIMAAVQFNALQPDTGFRFEASWTRRWRGYQLVIREIFPRVPSGSFVRP